MRAIYSVCVSLATGLKEMICLTLQDYATNSTVVRLGNRDVVDDIDKAADIFEKNKFW